MFDRGRGTWAGDAARLCEGGCPGGGGGIGGVSVRASSAAYVFAGIVIVGRRGRVLPCSSPEFDSAEVFLEDSEVDGLASATDTTTFAVGLGGFTISKSGTLGLFLVRLIFRGGKCLLTEATWIPKPVSAAMMDYS